MQLKPQDVLVTLKFLSRPEAASYARMADQLAMSASEVHAATRRAHRAQLLSRSSRGDWTPNHRNVREFLLFGLRYVFVPERGPEVRGLRTGMDALPSRGGSDVVPRELPWVWPHPEGRDRGQSLTPLYKAAPKAAMRDERLHAYLALVDELRVGRTREREQAAALIDQLMEKSIRCGTPCQQGLG